MKAVRSARALALTFAAVFVTAVFATAGSLAVGVAPAVALPVDVTGTVVLDVTGGTPLANIPVEVRDPDTNVLQARVTTDGTGAFDVPSIPDGDWVVVARGGSTYADAFDVVSFPADSRAVDELILVSDVVVLSGTVRNGTTHKPLAGIGVTASNATDDFPDFDLTDSLGRYSITVPRPGDYDLFAEDLPGDFYPQLWDHQPLLGSIGGCGCSAAIQVASAGAPVPAGPYDFDLHPIATSIWVTALAGDNTVSTPIPGIEMRLYLKSGNGWTRVDHRVTDDDGLADVFGPKAGKYRLYYAYNGVLVSAVDAAVITGGGPAPAALSADGCYIDLGSLSPSTSFPGNISIVLFDTPGSCTAPKAPTKAAPPATTTSGGGGGSTSVVSAPVVTPSATPTPEVTPTSTPAPSAGPTTEPSSSPSPSASPVPASSVDLWWVWIVVVVLLLAIIVTIVVMVRRR